MDTVTIYMSTYNGEKYLSEQIDSILSQKNVDVTLVIRDDGSTDNTKNIIKSYLEKNKNIVVIEGENIGYANSFLSLLKTDFGTDYYAFSDQDDIWLSDKLSRAISKIKGSKKTVYSSALTVVDENDNITSIKRFPKYVPSVGSVLSRTRLPGCTMVFDRELYVALSKNADKIMRLNKFNYGHDGWVLIYTLLNSGKIIVDSKSYIHYRRHSNTVTNIRGGIVKRLKNEWIIFFNKDNKRQRIANFILKNSEEYYDKKALDTLCKIKDYKKKISIRFRLIISDDISCGVPLINLKNKIAVLVGRY